MKRLLLSLVIVVSIACDSVHAASSQDTRFRSDPLPQANLSAPAGINAGVMKHQWDAGALPNRADLYTSVQQPATRAGTDRIKTPLRDQPRKATPRRLAHFPNYPCYRTVVETYSDLSQLATAYPELASWVDIGDSWDKATTGGPAGYDLYALVLTNKARPGPKFKFFLMAAIHARELATAELAARFAEKLVAEYGVAPDATWLLDYGEVHIVPIVNPDGRKQAEQGQSSWRKNTDNNDGCTTVPNYGTDLNRNSSFHWGGGSTGACDIEYQGPSAASEPETQAIQNYVASILPDQRGPGDDDPAPGDATGVFVTLHSYGRQVLFPYAFRPTEAPNNAQLETLGRKFGYLNGYTVCQIGEADCKYLTTGTTDDWTYGELGVAAYTIELGTAFFESCSSFESTILPQNLAVLSYAFKAARRPYQSPAGPDSLQVTVTQSLVVAGTPVTLTAVGDDTRYNSNGWGSEPVQNISAARYTVDAPSWSTGIVAHSMTPSDGAFNSSTEAVRAVVDTSGWAGGRHLLLVESRDAWGNWGVPSAVFLGIIEQYGVVVSPAVAAGQANPGQTISYTLRVTNTGNIADTFDVAVSGNAWPTAAASAVGPLAAGGNTNLNVTVTVPAAALAGAADAARIALTSRGDLSQSAAVVLTTTANTVYQVAVAPPAATRWGDPGVQITYTLRVTNTGNIADTFDVDAVGNTWPVVEASTVGPLAAGSGTELDVVVTVPEAATGGATDAVEISVTSRGDPTRHSTSVLTTTANVIHRVVLEPMAAARSGGPGTTVTYTLRLTNTGNATDTFTLGCAGSNWNVQLSPATSVTLPAGAGSDVTAQVTIPSTVTSVLSDTALVQVTGVGVFEVSSLTTRIVFHLYLPVTVRHP